jgi:large subunit ribosomal protein L18
LTLKNTILQIIEAESIGDKVIVSAHSQELVKKHGWLGGCGNIPSAYLTGLICGFKALSKNVEKAFLDIGLHIPSKGTRIFAALKGVIDAGVQVPHSEEILPDESRISGKHIEDYANKLSLEPELYKQKFSKSLSRGSRPEDLSKHFFAIKNKIVSEFERKVKE